MPLKGVKLSDVERPVRASGDPMARAKRKMLAGIDNQIRLAGDDSIKGSRWPWIRDGIWHTYLYYGKQPLKLAKISVEIGPKSKIVATFKIIRKGIENGELDTEIERTMLAMSDARKAKRG